MFLIPDFHQDALPFEESVAIIKRRGNGDLLEGLKEMDRIWDEYAKSSAGDDPIFEDDFAFYDNWCYEVNAYNVVVENMRPLFH